MNDDSPLTQTEKWLDDMFDPQSSDVGFDRLEDQFQDLDHMTYKEDKDDVPNL